MPPSDTTTLRLNDTTHAAQPSSLWLVWGGANAAPPLRLEQAPLLLGRTGGVGSVEAAGVSRRHAELVRQGPLFVVADLGSTNGTFLNGAPVQRAALSEGDVLRLGDAVAVVVRMREDVAPPRVEEPCSGVLFGPGLLHLLADMRKLAPGDLPIVIEGATGVGKEGIARTLHELSTRRGPLQAVNCAALPASLAEAELFGHSKGAFTGAERAALGHFRAADQGTLFLDELYDLAPAVQAKLLRALQERSVVPLGETRAISVDVRVVAASLVPLAELVETQRLREDLAARLAGVSLVVPPLRERRADIAALFTHFLGRYSGGRPPAVDGKLLEHLLLSPWPGNVRELELMVRRLLALHGHEPTLRRSMLDDVVSAAPARPASVPPAKRRGGDDDEADILKLRAAFASHGNLSKAAQQAGISRQRAYRLLDGRSPRDLLAPSPDEPNED